MALDGGVALDDANGRPAIPGPEAARESELEQPPGRAGPTTRLLAIVRDPVWLDAIVPTVLLRVVILLFGVAAVVIFRGEALPHGSLLEIWDRWDAPHFFELARLGYGPPADPARIVLFPALPALIALGSLVTEPLVAGMVISFISTLAAAIGLYRLVRFDEGRESGRAAVLFMSLFPTAFTLIAPYSEAPFLAFTVWSFVMARQGRWPAAGLFALFAGATRIQGAFLLPALILEYWLSKRRIDRGAAVLFLAAGGPVIYLWINFATFGDPLYFIGIQDTVFHVSTAAPWVAIPNIVNGAIAFQPTEFWATVYFAPFAALVILLVVALWTIFGRGSRPSYAVYTILSLLSFASLTWPISVPRYLMGVFPIFMAAGRIGRIPWLGPPLLAGSTLLFGVCLTLFVIGHWAF